MCVIGGMVAGFIVGDWVMTGLQQAFGYLASGIVLGIGGALLGGLGHEVVANFSRPE
jgi:uncharacterized membrane protein YeaQ/YmgE (transglycosylase-associated protein family)